MALDAKIFGRINLNDGERGDAGNDLGVDGVEAESVEGVPMMRFLLDFRGGVENDILPTISK
jgi:hypothetical protein